MMLNGHCRVTAHPFVNECNKKWWVADVVSGTDLLDNRNIKFHDPYVTLECKNKGK